ncbi:MAG: response regulator transcription factor [Steroidobacteraceae bacterium]
MIVDDHPIVRQGLRHLLNAEADFEVCAEAPNKEEALAAFERMRPDAMIVDLSLEHGDGMELVRDIRQRDTQLPILVLSMHEESIYAERLIAQGASGYIMKQAASGELLGALRCVLSGEIYLSEIMRQHRRPAVRDLRALDAESPLQRLSNRELQVLGMVGRGVSSRQIAVDLGLSVKTVESHRQSIKRKLRLDTNSQLMQFAVSCYSTPQGAMQI